MHLIAVLVLAVAPAVAQEVAKKNEFLFVAHRGASYLAPENTLASITLAWELGAEAAECDVMLTADKRIILFHDNKSKRLTGESFIIKETNWEHLKGLTIKGRKSNHKIYENEPIPLLKNVLDIIPEDRMLVIEIKTGPEILPYLKPLIDKHWKSGTISFIAFDFETIKSVKALYPKISCYYLSSLKTDLNNRLNDIVTCKLDGVDLSHSIIDEAVIDKCSDLGLEVWCWTVNDLKTARRMKKLGVIALTTDRPAWLKENL